MVRLGIANSRMGDFFLGRVARAWPMELAPLPADVPREEQLYGGYGRICE
jgi:hypothetical protein